MIFMEAMRPAGQSVTLTYVITKAHLTDVQQTVRSNAFQRSLRANLGRYTGRDIPVGRVTDQGWHNGQCAIDKVRLVQKAMGMTCDEEGWYSKLQCQRTSIQKFGQCWCTDRHT